MSTPELARTRHAAHRVAGAVVRPARRLVNRVAGPSRGEVEALPARVAQLTAEVDALVERLTGAPVVVDTLGRAAGFGRAGVTGPARTRGRAVARVAAGAAAPLVARRTEGG